MIEKLFVTYCTGKKKEDKENIPAIQRYKSDRIKWVYGEAIKENAEFAILSGIFGLISPETEIPKYDYCLQEDDVCRIKETNKSYIQKKIIKNGIREIVYFTKSPQLDKESVNYYYSLKSAITELKKEGEKIDFDIRILNYEAFSIKEEKFEELIEKNKLKILCKKSAKCV